MEEKIRCPYCGGSSIIKRGIRKLKTKKKQRYFCNSCHHRFSLSFERKRSSIKVVLSSVCAYNQGLNCEEVRDIVYRNHNVLLHKSTIARWVKEYDLGYLSIRQTVLSKHKHPLIIGRVFKHFGIVYNFRCHKGKLEAFGKFQGLKRFVFKVIGGVDGRYFIEDNERCSQLRKETSVNLKVIDNAKLSRVVGSVLKLVANNRQRHSIVETLMLNCDRDTVAVEVPVWYWDKDRNVGVCGHIDILQVKYGKAWVLDYKPNAEQEDIDKVVSQLSSYALALSFRTGVRLEDVKCGWFDESKMYLFDACDAEPLRGESLK
ncbi:IS1 family transposase [Candidatus Woesearchaeota archaeon]|nr:IS1 family transposase [Candidatus Woesearchaeota archaeon]